MRGPFEPQASRTRAIAFLLTMSTLVIARPADADEKQACLGAFDKAQQLRLDGKLRAAREQLALCARSECPPLVRQDCATWMNDVMGSLPSVVVGARDAHGKDVFAVRVIVDGTEVASALDGKPILIDPGAHKLRFETAGAAPVEEQVLIREGERNRAVTISFAPPKSDDPKKNAKSHPDAPAPPHGDVVSGPPVAAYVLAGASAVALGSALFFDLTANRDAIALRDGCAPACAQKDVDAVDTKYVVAAISLGVGIVAAGVATYLFVTSGQAGKRASAWPFGVHPLLSARGVGASF